MSIVLMLFLSALFDVKTIPLHTPDSHVFLAHADRDTQADVFVLEKGAITVFSSVASSITASFGIRRRMSRNSPWDIARIGTSARRPTFS